MKVYIATVHYGNKEELTKNFVDNFIKTERFEEIVIANNNKYDLKIDNPKVKIINNKKNLGWGGGINSTLPYIMAHNPDYIFIINNDCVTTFSILPKLTALIQSNENIGLVSPALIFNKNGKETFDLGGYINEKKGTIFHKEFSQVKNKIAHPIDFSGTVMIKTAVLSRIKGFDEDFFLYMEDVDFCLRAKKSGYLTYIHPEAVVSHIGSATLGAKNPITIYHQTRSSIIFIKKYYGLSRKSIPFFVQEIILTLKRLKDPRSAIYSLVAFYDIFLNKKRFNN